MFTFTSLYGAQNPSPASSSLLELDGGIKILIDVGWDNTFSTELLQSIEQHASTISLILLTHPTIDHLGAYAHACKHIPTFNRIPVYATIPVVNLGLTLLTDLYASSVLAASIIPTNAISGVSNGETESETNLLLQPPTIDELSKYFNHITPLKYSQPHQPIAAQFSPSLDGLTISAYSAGHTLGGTIWHIQHNMESIVYAADWKQGRENLLGGAAWLAASSGGAEIIEPLRRPTALVCSSRGVEVEEPLSKQKRDARLVALVRETLEQGGKVLIPTDSSARVLELAFLLNKTWQDNVDGPRAALFKNAKLYMASKSASATKRYLQSMLEWMDDAIIRDAEAAMTSKGDKTNSPLEWKFVRLIERQKQLDRALTRNMPSVILASDSIMDWAFSKHALQSLAGDSKNLIILTEETAGNGLGSQIRKLFEGQSMTNIITPSEVTLRSQIAETAALEEQEQAIYNQYLARQRSINATALPSDGIEGDNVVADADAAASESSDSDEEDENNDDPTAQQQGRALNLSTQVSSVKRKVGLTDAELGIDILLTSKAHDYDVRGKRGKEKMYPYRTSRKRDDDFGESIVVGDYLRAEEREEIEDAQNAVTDRKVGEKRKWDDAATGPSGVSVKGKKNGVQNKKARTEPDDIDAAIARATGEATDINGVDKTASDSEDSEYDPDDDEEIVAGPRKVIFKDLQFDLSARVAYVDFSARHERRDLLMLIPLIRPRKLILISGNESQTQMLAQESRALLQSNGKSAADATSSTEVYTPTNGEQIDASVDTNAWTLKLGTSLLRRLVWQDIRGLGIVTLTGLLHAQEEKSKEEAEDGDEDEITRKKRKLAANTTSDESKTEQDDAKKELLPVLDLPSTTSSIRNNTSQALTTINRPIHVGDLRLSDLRNLLRQSGHIAEFRGEGTLLVDGIVVVRKSASGRIEVEGGVYGIGARGITGESVFGEVKRKVYEGLAVVGGGSLAAAS